jgi:hypothetical protein
VAQINLTTGTNELWHCNTPAGTNVNGTKVFFHLEQRIYSSNEIPVEQMNMPVGTNHLTLNNEK